MDTQKMISEECDAVKALLLRKNAECGDSIINPKRVFSSASIIEQLDVRIDDKLSRIMNRGPQDNTEDTGRELIGYLILRRIAIKLQ